jgi:hypothetical protein
MAKGRRLCPNRCRRRVAGNARDGPGDLRTSVAYLTQSPPLIVEAPITSVVFAGISQERSTVVAAKRPGEYLDTVISLEELAAMLAPFGMMVQIDPEADRDYMAMQMSHALVGVVEAHASRAEDAYRQAAAKQEVEPREVHDDITQAALMAFAGINCRSAADELALISWRATRLAGVLGTLDFPGPIKRNGWVGSGDTLIRTMRLVAAALSAMATAAEKAADPRRGPGEAAQAGQALVRAMAALQEAAKDADLHRATGDLMTMTD